MNDTISPPDQKIACFHCDEPCLDHGVQFSDKYFCCNGCKAVYELLSDSDLLDFYTDQKDLGNKSDFDFLENDKLSEQFVVFKSEDLIKVKFKLPSIHCSSCIYVLENLHTVEIGVVQVITNFLKKEAIILFNPKVLSISALCNLLSSIGYSPDLSIVDKKDFSKRKLRDSLSLKIGIAAFCFGNVMLFSFPEYLGIDEQDSGYMQFFRWLSILLSFPVIFYSASGYFVSAYKGLKRGFFNIDIPIVLGVLTLFFRSIYEIIFSIGSGYLDSLAGLIFFLLIGRWFQNKTYENLSFERDYKSYFPLSVLKIHESQEIPTAVNDLKNGDLISIRSKEVIPADSVLLSDFAQIDYSFVTGEQVPVMIKQGEIIYAGGRQIGGKIKLSVLKECSQSYLTSLWNGQAFKIEKNSDSEELTNKISKNFTMVIVTIALVGGLYWAFTDSSKMWQVISAVLIVACPCALALSAPFANGNAIRILGRMGLYLKKATVVEKMAEIDTVIFDKTGTITTLSQNEVSYNGQKLEEIDYLVLKSMTSNSTHPISRMIFDSLSYNDDRDLLNFAEITNKGIQAEFGENIYRLGSALWLGADMSNSSVNEAQVHLEINNKVVGYFSIKQKYRPNIQELLKELGKTNKLLLVSGDNDAEYQYLVQLFPKDSKFYFSQKPEDKLRIVEDLQLKGNKVMMIGDGLNDAGALQQSNVGVAVTDDISSFSPACDAIIEGSKLFMFDKYLQFSKQSKSIIYQSFGLSFVYNALGISFALLGLLTPIFAALLMPVSSISVVLYTTLRGNSSSRKLKL